MKARGGKGTGKMGQVKSSKCGVKSKTKSPITFW